MRTFLIIFNVCLFSCSKSDEYYTKEIFNSQNLKAYGSWALLHPSDISKKALKVDELSFIFCDKLEISPIGHYKMYDGNTLRESGHIIIKKQTNDSLLIRFFPDERYQNNYLPNIHSFEFDGSDTLKLQYMNFKGVLGTFRRLY